MDKSYKSEWIKRLRSGDYAQTSGYLHIEEDAYKTGHCCLGVLCEIGVERGVVTRSTPGTIDIFDDLGDHNGFSSNSGFSSTLPYKFRDTVKIPNTKLLDLVEMNDSYGKSFDEIADYIESNL